VGDDTLYSKFIAIQTFYKMCKLLRSKLTLTKSAPWNFVKTLKGTSCLPLSEANRAPDFSHFRIRKVSVGSPEEFLSMAVSRDEYPLRTATVVRAASW